MRRQRLVVPKFATEAEEAEWWDRNREQVSRDFEEASRAGELNVLTKEKLRERLARAAGDHPARGSRISQPRTSPRKSIPDS